MHLRVVPSAAAVMVQVPSPTAVTVPPELTVATEELLVDQPKLSASTPLA